MEMGGFGSFFVLVSFFEVEEEREEGTFLMKGCETERRGNLTIEKSYILVYNI